MSTKRMGCMATLSARLTDYCMQNLQRRPMLRMGEVLFDSSGGVCDVVGPVKLTYAEPHR
jgi:uncharacterized protein (DUF779 family)